jgi:hypothetical protein
MLSGLVGCAGMNDMLDKYNVTKQTVQSFEVATANGRRDAAFIDVTAILVDRGFDIKVSNKDVGLISTEFKKFASVSSQGGAPFDYYLQIKATVRDGGAGKTLIRLSPIVKEQNRMNVAAFTEHELYYFEGTPEGVRAADKGGWAAAGQTIFMNVASDLSAKVRVPVENMTRNITSKKFNTLLGS